MEKRIYVETTVVSYLTAKPSRDIMIASHQEATRELWPELLTKYDAYISALVFEEAKRGDPDQAKMRLAAIEPFPLLDIDDEARSLQRISLPKKQYLLNIRKTLSTSPWLRSMVSMFLSHGILPT
jgi:hypothetical protein